MSSTMVNAEEPRTASRHKGLDRLRPGEQGRVIGFVDDRTVARRLRAMGVYPGCPVTLLRSAPLRDPLQVQVGGFSLSLRRADAALITVELD